MGADRPLSLVFVLVPESKMQKNRLHLDLAMASVEAQEATVERLLSRGAARSDIGQENVPWVVLTDPEGNEFCVLDPRECYQGAEPLAAVVIDATDPAELARFWVEAAGWPIGLMNDNMVRLHRPGDQPPYIEFVRVSDAKMGKNRVHLDVSARPNGDREAEVDRLLGLGAQHVNIGQGREVPWVVLTDPEGNEFCVLE
jgi:predicted enzyme related to lactoylglutathione lyase